MKSVLLKMFVNGIKCINKELEISFYNNALKKKFDNADSHVKAIYGPNGAGKTGIVYAAEIFRNIIIDPSYLTLNNASGSLYNIINQTSRELFVKMIFALINEESEIINVYSYFVNLKNIDGNYEINEEELKKLSGLKINIEEKYSAIFRVKNGNVIDFISKEDFPAIKEMTMNLLRNKSFASIIEDRMKKENSDINLSAKIQQPVNDLLFFAKSMRILMQNFDRNYVNLEYVGDQIDAINAIKEKVDKKTFSQLLIQNKIPQKGVFRVHKSLFDNYKAYIANLTTFIKVFKDDLIEIAIKKDKNGDFYECELELCYKDGKQVNLKYESTGIKKIINLYVALCDIERGCIVFIDEFDANIHDVLLIKLIQYIMQFASGQLIFTTHNLGPMDVLQKAKKSIDFLSPDSRIVSWTKNGNYTAASQYSKGLIEYSPFNIESFSFLGIFGEK